MCLWLDGSSRCIPWSMLLNKGTLQCITHHINTFTPVNILLHMHILYNPQYSLLACQIYNVKSHGYQAVLLCQQFPTFWRIMLCSPAGLGRIQGSFWACFATYKICWGQEVNILLHNTATILYYMYNITLLQNTQAAFGPHTALYWRGTEVLSWG